MVDFFGLSDIYGACAAAMCEAKDGLHIVEDQILVETVDPVTGEVLEPGERGRARVHHAHEEGPPHDPLPHGRYRLLLHRRRASAAARLGRIHITGRKDEMFIVGAVNVFPTDVEYVVRAEKGLTGEYLIRVYDENFTHPLRGVRGARAQGSDEPYDAVADARDGGAQGPHRRAAGAASSCTTPASSAPPPSTRRPASSTSAACAK